MIILKCKCADWMIRDDYWRLIQGNDGLYLFVHCEKEIMEYNELIKLNEFENNEYRLLGWLYLQYLSNRINALRNEYMNRFVRGKTYDDIIIMINTNSILDQIKSAQQVDTPEPAIKGNSALPQSLPPAR
ncbi:hypothetical protein LBMAG53_21760 [Planctomycetota bacterium]|nr:hypothetical protein LBMAG53_21760 [Planctomycetota bacterium]